jgi:hypothetical protein
MIYLHSSLHVAISISKIRGGRHQEGAIYDHKGNMELRFAWGVGEPPIIK